MPILAFLVGKSFDPETLDVLNEAFLGVCDDLAVRDNARHSREVVAKAILQIADGTRDPEAIRTTVVAFLKAQY